MESESAHDALEQGAADGAQQGNKAHEALDTGPQRLFWVDWSRTQSVWNVVCGHVWWSTVDELNLRRWDGDFRRSWTEGQRMLEYTVDQGAFHTVPLFFLVSGFLASKTLRVQGVDGDQGIGSFLIRRTKRILPPFLVGIALLAIERVARDAWEDVQDLVLSHLWFLWALMLMQTFFMPWCIMLRLAGRPSDAGPYGRRFAINFAVFVLACAVLGVVLEVAFEAASEGKGGWIAAIPVATIVPLPLLCGGPSGVSPATRDALRSLGVAALVLLSFLAAAHEMCPAPKCDQYDWLTVNTAQGIAIIGISYAVGFASGEAEGSLTRTFARGRGQAVAVGALLLSCYWPFFTYWGEQYVRRTAFTISYQDHETYSIANRGGSPAGSSPGPGWALARTWAWAGLMLLFGRAFCDTQVHPFLHKHVTQSGVVVFVAHRLFDPAIAKALHEGGVDDPIELYVATVALVFACSFGMYALLASNRYTAAMIGIASASRGVTKPGAGGGGESHA